MKRIYRLPMTILASLAVAPCWAGTYGINGNATSVTFQSVTMSGYTQESYGTGMVYGCSHTFETDFDVTATLIQRTFSLSLSASGSWTPAYTWGLVYTPSGPGDVPTNNTLVVFQCRDHVYDAADLEAIDTVIDGSSTYNCACNVIPGTQADDTNWAISLSGQCPMWASRGTSGTWDSPRQAQGNSGVWTLGGDGNYYSSVGITAGISDGMGAQISYAWGDKSKCIASMRDQVHEQWTISQVGTTAITPWA